METIGCCWFWFWLWITLIWVWLVTVECCRWLWLYFLVQIKLQNLKIKFSGHLKCIKSGFSIYGCDARAVCVCVCLSVCPPSRVWWHISVGGEGNALYPALSSLDLCLVFYSSVAFYCCALCFSLFFLMHVCRVIQWRSQSVIKG